MKDLLKSLSTLSEGETKDTKTGRVHKGSYGSEYDTDREGNEVKKAAPDVKKGRGRPKKDGGEDSPKFDTSALSGVFGGGKKPSKQVGTVSKKHSLKEYIESIEAEKTQLDEADQITIQPAQQNTQVIQQGDKTLGTVTNPQLANQLKQALSKGEMSLATDDTQGMAEEVDTGEYDARKPVKSEPAGDWDKDFREKLKAYVKELEQRQAQKAQSMAEGKKKPDANKNSIPDYAEDGKGKNDLKKKKVDESISLSESPETLQHIISKFKNEVKRFIAGEELDNDLFDALFDYYGDAGELPYGVAKGRTGDPFEWVTQRFNQDVHDHVVDESTARAFTQHALAEPTQNFTKPGSSMAVPKGTPTKINRPVPEPTPWGTDPIAAASDRAFNFIDSLGKGTKFTKEGTEMKDIQLESWESQLNSLLTEGITVSSSQGQQGAPDSVSVTATETDADALLSVLRNAGIGGFGAEPAAPEIGYGVAQGGEEDFDGTGTEPQPSPDVVGDDGDMLSMLKKMAGLDSGDAVVAVGGEEGQDYEDEAGGEAQPQTLEPASDEEGSEESEEEQTDEGIMNTVKNAVGLGNKPPATTAEKNAAFHAANKGQNMPSSGNAKDDYDYFTGRDKVLGGEEQTDEGNAFGQEVRQKKSDNIPDSQQRITTGGKNLPVKEEATCESCGCVHEGETCDTEQVEENFANTPGHGTEEQELAKLKALLSMGNDMHRMKQSQAMGNPVRVAESDALAQWKKLSGI